MITVRRATVADADQIAALAVRLLPLGCPEKTKPEDLSAYSKAELTPARFRQHMQDPAIVVLAGEHETILAGYMMIALRSANALVVSPKAVEFCKLYVDPAHHGRGVAARLMDEALATVEADEGCPVWLSCFSENFRAQSFYKKFGFEIIGEQVFQMGSDPQRDFVMLRPPARGLRTS
jgi:ribosomal protein S18 acetylase RimI-like enzyme